MPKKVLIADKLGAGKTRTLVQILEQAEIEAVILEDPGLLGNRDYVQEFDAIFVRSKTRITSDFLGIFTGGGKKLIIRGGTGFDNVYNDETKHKIDASQTTVVSTPFANIDSVVGLTIAYMNCFAYGMNHENDFAKDIPEWTKNERAPFILRGKTIGILGMGRIGYELAVAARANKMEVVAYEVDPVARKRAEDAGFYVTDNIEDLFCHPDLKFISINVPLIDGQNGTYHLVNSRLLKLAKNTRPYLMLTSRGEVADISGVDEALSNGCISGFATDVYENEKKVIAAIKEKDYSSAALVPYARIARKYGDSVIITPHIGASTPEAQELVALHSAQAIIDFFRGNMPSINAPYIIVNKKGG